MKNLKPIKKDYLHISYFFTKIPDPHNLWLRIYFQFTSDFPHFHFERVFVNQNRFSVSVNFLSGNHRQTDITRIRREKQSGINIINGHLRRVVE
jgi:hypothetical protein